MLRVGSFKESGEVDNTFERTFDTQVILATVNFNNLCAIAPCVLGGTLFVRA